MRINYRTHPALKLLKEEELLRHIHPKERVLFEENKDISEYMSTDIWRNRQMSKKPLFYITNEFQKNAEQSHNAIERVLVKNRNELVPISGHYIWRDYIISCASIINYERLSVVGYMFYFHKKYGVIGISSGGTIEGTEHKIYYAVTPETCGSNETTMDLLQDLYFVAVESSLFQRFASIKQTVVAANSRVKDSLSKYINDSNVDCTILDSTWFTEIHRNEGFKVRGHFRLQPYKNEQGEWDHKLIYINEFEKHGYHRRAGKQIQEESAQV